ncbi:hypothetical protein AAMO2058_000651900 [Amorphochlora amoebiformis]
MSEPTNEPAESGSQKVGIGGLVWSMTGGLISRLSGTRERPIQPASKTSEARKGFWNRKPSNASDSAKQVRGAQYPPLTRPEKMPVTKQPESKNYKRQGSDQPMPVGPEGSEATKPHVEKVIEEEKGDTPIEEKKDKEMKQKRASANSLTKCAAIFKLINESNLDMSTLRKQSWSGLCAPVRSDVWQLILGYQPTNRERRGPTVAKRRKEYQDHCRNIYFEDESRYSSSERKIMHQIRLDTPRTLPGLTLLQHKSIQKLLERILYIWSVRHPASGYVQGINDLVIPFLMVFLAARNGVELTELEEKHVTAEHLKIVEADCFWCMSNLIDGIQDNYTSSQPGIQRMVFKLQELIHRLDQPLHDHLKSHEVRFFDFSYRWMNCVLVRELSMPLIVRVWDTYIAQPDGCKVFHVYMCAAMLQRFSAEIRSLTDFHDLMMYLQNLPTKDWTEKDVETLLAQAYVYMYQFEGAENHLH